jgi:glycerophosphoryl diester phosphodiesterase
VKSRSPSQSPYPRPGHPYFAGSPLLIAHRGGSRLAPENTLVAFQNAAQLWGADMLEMDVQLTRDGEVVVIHDETVDRTTAGTGRVGDLTLSQLQELDAGYRFRDPDGKPNFRGVGVTIPRFEDVLLALPDIRMNVETKDGISAPALVEIILRHGAQDRVLVAAEFEKNRMAVRGYPGPWGASREDLLQFFRLVYWPWADERALACDVLQIPEKYRGIRLLNRRVLEQAHIRNLPIHVWTVDDAEDMRRLVRMGVDGVQTDRPDRLASVLTEEAGRPPPPVEARGDPSRQVEGEHVKVVGRDGAEG